jgi:signal transduction histidine kinase
MKLQNRLFLAVIVVAVAALGIFFYATTSVILSAFTKIEDENIRVNTARVVDAVSERVDQLELKATDWASWDDTYAFVVNHNAAYVKSNLSNGSLGNLGINYMLFFNDKQQLVTSKSISGENDRALPQPLVDNFKPGSKLLATSPDSSAKGLLLLPDRVVQFVALPILTSDGTGPMHGTLVFAYDLDQAEATDLSSITHLQAAFYRLNDPSRPADVKAAIGDKPTGAKFAIKKPGENESYGYQTIDDVNGHPILVARVERSRDIHQTAKGAVIRFLLITLLLGAIASVLITVLMMIIKGRDRTIKLKNEFFSIASHELRTPLTVIRDYAQLMKFQFSKTVNDPKFDHMADQIDQAGAQLIGVVNVYLDAARLESGKIPFQPQPFAMIDIAKALGPQLQATGKAKNVSVVMDCNEALPQVIGDKERVQQIVLNLFGNALKFTDTGSITIKAEPRDKMMMVYVTDTGRGMDEAAQHKLFQRFSQVQSKDALRGSGLGLFISKKLVEQMGGQIQVESSAPGIGTTISFSLPLAPVTPVPVTPAPAAPAATPAAIPETPPAATPPAP